MTEIRLNNTSTNVDVTSNNSDTSTNNTVTNVDVTTNSTVVNVDSQSTQVDVVNNEIAVVYFARGPQGPQGEPGADGQDASALVAAVSGQLYALTVEVSGALSTEIDTLSDSLSAYTLRSETAAVSSGLSTRIDGKISTGQGSAGTWNYVVVSADGIVTSGAFVDYGGQVDLTPYTLRTETAAVSALLQDTKAAVTTVAAISAGLSTRIDSIIIPDVSGLISKVEVAAVSAGLQDTKTSNVTTAAISAGLLSLINTKADASALNAYTSRTETADVSAGLQLTKAAVSTVAAISAGLSTRIDGKISTGQGAAGTWNNVVVSADGIVTSGAFVDYSGQVDLSPYTLRTETAAVSALLQDTKTSNVTTAAISAGLDARISAIPVLSGGTAGRAAIWSGTNSVSASSIIVEQSDRVSFNKAVDVTDNTYGVLVKSSSASLGFSFRDRETTPGYQMLFEAQKYNAGSGPVINITMTGSSSATPATPQFSCWPVEFGAHQAAYNARLINGKVWQNNRLVRYSGTIENGGWNWEAGTPSEITVMSLQPSSASQQATLTLVGGANISGASEFKDLVTFRRFGGSPEEYTHAGGTDNRGGWHRVSNANADLLVGVARSIGGDLFSGATAYAAGIGTNKARDFHQATNGIVRTTVTSGGNFLIGTTTDDGSNKLQVSGSVLATRYRAGSSAGDGFKLQTATYDFGFIKDTAGSGGYDGASFRYEGAADLNVYSYGSGLGTVNWLITDGRFIVGTDSDNGNDRLQVSGSVNIGGYPGGSDTLKVNGTIRTTGIVYAPYLHIPGNSTHAFQYGNDSSAGGTYVYDASVGSYRMVIKDGGNVLIGTTTDNSGAKLQVNGLIGSSSLTNSRVPFTTGGALNDSNCLRFNASAGSGMFVGDGTGGRYYVLDGGAGQERGFLIRTGGSNRWQILASTASEAGSNAGSNLQIAAYSDAGTTIDVPVTINRAPSGTIQLARVTLVNSTTNYGDSYKLQVNGDVMVTATTGARIGWNNAGNYFNWMEAGGIANNNYIRFACGNTEVMRLRNSSGIGGTAVLIGTTAEEGSYKLQVAGTSYFSGTINVGTTQTTANAGINIYGAGQGGNRVTVNLASSGARVENAGIITAYDYSVNGGSGATQCGVRWSHSANSYVTQLKLYTYNGGANVQDSLILTPSTIELRTGAEPSDTTKVVVTTSSISASVNGIFAGFGNGAGMRIGQWAIDSNYGVIQNHSLSTGDAGAFALIQNNSGQTILNSAAGQNLSLKINNATKLMINGANDNVLIGTTTDNSSGVLQVNGGGWFGGKLRVAIPATSTIVEAVRIQTPLGAVSAGSTIDWWHTTGAANLAAYARIGGITDSGGNGGMLTFYTTPTFGTAASERMRINQNGRILVNTFTDNGVDIFQVSGSAGISGALAAQNIKRGTGSPEGVTTGNVGDVYQRVDGGTGTSLYVKESGSGNTGWTAVSAGSTGGSALSGGIPGRATIWSSTSNVSASNYIVERTDGVDVNGALAVKNSTAAASTTAGALLVGLGTSIANNVSIGGGKICAGTSVFVGNGTQALRSDEILVARGSAMVNGSLRICDPAESELFAWSVYSNKLHLYQYNGSQNRLVISANGNVVMGADDETTSTDKLQVTGSIYATGMLRLDNLAGQSNPLSGSFYFDAAQRAFVGKSQPGNDDFVSSMMIRTRFSNTGRRTINNTVAETSFTTNNEGPTTNIGSWNNSGAFWVPGKIVKINVFGAIQNTGTPTLRLRLKDSYGTSLYDSTAVTMSTIIGVRAFKGEYYVRCQSVGSTGAFVSCGGMFTYGTAGNTQSCINVASTPLIGIRNGQGGDNGLDFTATWGTNSTSNGITGNCFYLEEIN